MFANLEMYAPVDLTEYPELAAATDSYMLKFQLRKLVTEQRGEAYRLGAKLAPAEDIAKARQEAYAKGMAEGKKQWATEQAKKEQEKMRQLVSHLTAELRKEMAALKEELVLIASLEQPPVQPWPFETKP